MPSRPILIAPILGALTAIWLQAYPALAQPAPEAPEADKATQDIWSRPNLLGGADLRARLAKAGVTIGLSEISEVLAQTSGGLKQGATYDGLTTLSLQLDTANAGLWNGGLFNVSSLQIHGRNLNQYYTASLQTPSSIEALPTTRLWELWFQQKFLADRLDVRLGLQSVDEEFLTSRTGSIFLNTATGWPALPSVDLYAGGPAYPLSSLGVRVKLQPSEPVTLLAGVFQDNPPGGPFTNDSQLRGASRIGANFSLRTGALFLAELQYLQNQPPIGDGPKPEGLPFALKFGGFYDTANFPDQRFDATGRSLASPLSTGTDRNRTGNASLYGVADLGIWRPSSTSEQLVSLYAKIQGAPGDRNQVDFAFVGGVTLKAPFPSRDNDVAGISYGMAKISDRAQALDRDQAFIAGAAVPIRTSEQFIEVTYLAQVTPWLQVQPDFQYILRPSGGIADPNRPGRRIGDAAIFGIRTNITF